MSATIQHIHTFFTQIENRDSKLVIGIRKYNKFW